MIPPYKIKKIEDFLPGYDPGRHVLIDARTPAEFREDHVPGAINLPVLSDEERSHIGILYKENSFEARHFGAILVSKNIAGILPRIESISREHAGGNGSAVADIQTPSRYHKPDLEFVVYCWRGGMRSGSLFTVMDLIGYRTAVIEGGYRSYRRMIHDTFYNELPPIEVISIHGPSGSGKSELLQRLSEAGQPALFLEEYANHKGSLLGGDFATQPSQKEFESRFWHDLHPLLEGKRCIVEGESRQIGRLSIPNLFFDRMRAGPKIWVELPIEERARRLAAEYNEERSVLSGRLDRLQKYLSRSIFADVQACIAADDLVGAAHILLREHYDRYYRRSAPEVMPGYRAVCRADSFEDLAKSVLDAVRVPA